MSTQDTTHESTILWHEWLGHPSIKTMHKMIEKHSFTNMPFTKHHLISLTKSKFICIACTQGKIIKNPLTTKTHTHCTFMSRIHKDICGHISLTSNDYRYFMPIIEERTRKGIVILLHTKNEAYAWILKTIFTLLSKYPKSQLQTIRLDNAAEFQ
jgi:GAG-pre-integrase domain